MQKRVIFLDSCPADLLSSQAIPTYLRLTSSRCSLSTQQLFQAIEDCLLNKRMDRQVGNVYYKCQYVHGMKKA